MLHMNFCCHFMFLSSYLLTCTTARESYMVSHFFSLSAWRLLFLWKYRKHVWWVRRALNQWQTGKWWTNNQPSHGVGGIILLQVLCCLPGCSSRCERQRSAGKPGVPIFFSPPLPPSLYGTGDRTWADAHMPRACPTTELYLYPNISRVDYSLSLCLIFPSPPQCFVAPPLPKIWVSGSASETINSDAFRPFIWLLGWRDSKASLACEASQPLAHSLHSDSGSSWPCPGHFSYLCFQEPCHTFCAPHRLTSSSHFWFSAYHSLST